MICFKHRGNFKKTQRFLAGATRINLTQIITPYAQQGVSALSAATPKRSGEAALSWGYEIIAMPGKTKIVWTNSKMAGNIPLVLLIHYGHATRTGGYVQGFDFINPTLRPIFDRIADDIWKEVSRL